jgi:hypothetical protein
MTSDDIALTILSLPEPIKQKYLTRWWEISEHEGVAYFHMPQATFDALPKKAVIVESDENDLKIPAKTLLGVMK